MCRTDLLLTAPRSPFFVTNYNGRSIIQSRTDQLHMFIKWSPLPKNLMTENWSPDLILLTRRAMFTRVPTSS